MNKTVFTTIITVIVIIIAALLYYYIGRVPSDIPQTALTPGDSLEELNADTQSLDEDLNAFEADINSDLEGLDSLLNEF